MTRQLERLTRTALVVATLALSVVNATAGPKHHGPKHGRSQNFAKLDQQLAALVRGGCDHRSEEVIVTAKPGYREEVRKSVHAHGKVMGEFRSLNAIVARMNCKDLKELAQSDEIEAISSNADLFAQATTSTKTLSTGTRTREKEGIDASELLSTYFQTIPVRTGTTSGYGTWTSSTGGSGIGIAVIDSGIAPVIDFDGRISHFYDFTGGGIKATAPSDEYGHGTHVAGLIGGTYTGVAPLSRLVGLKVLDAQGRGATDTVVRAIEFAIVNKALLGIQVINLSLGHPIYESAATDPLVQAVEHAVREGLIVVASAGNFGINQTTGQSGYAGLVSPGNAPSALTVGALKTFATVTRLDDRVAPYSSRGPSWYDGFAKPDVLAPGDNLLSVAADGSTLRTLQESRGNTGSYMRLSGTSMAAGVTSGVVALVLQANRLVTPNAVKAILEYTSIPVTNDDGSLADMLSQGAGSVEAAGALALARAIDARTLMGSPWLTTSVTPYSTIGDRSYRWSQHIIWGNHVAQGSTLLSEQRPAWAMGFVWGVGLGSEDDNIVWGNNIVWGFNPLGDDNIVWGNSFDFGDNIVWGNNIVWGFNPLGDDNIVWGNMFDDGDNIVWGNNIVWGGGLLGLQLDGDNIVWGNNWLPSLTDDNIVWGNLFDDNIVWGNRLDDDNVVWGNGLLDDDNVVWGNAALLGSVQSVRKGAK